MLISLGQRAATSSWISLSNRVSLSPKKSRNAKHAQLRSNALLKSNVGVKSSASEAEASSAVMSFDAHAQARIEKATTSEIFDRKHM